MAQRSDGIGALPAANDVQRALLARETGSYVMTPAGPVPADAGPTEAQTLNFLGAMTGVGGYADMLGQYPQMPAEDVTVSEMLQGPPGPSLAENLREGEYLDASLQALGAIPLVGAAAKGARGTRGIRAYQGGPTAHNKYSDEFLGTGEGAQVYGSGHYFAEAEDTAKNYRELLARRQPPDPENNAAQDYIDAYWDPETTDKDAFEEEFMGDIVGKEHHVRNRTMTYELRDGSFLQYDMNTNDFRSVGPKKGYMYEVMIDADPEELMDWDKKIIDQSDYVQQKLSDAGLLDYGALQRYKNLLKKQRDLDEIRSKTGGVFTEAQGDRYMQLHDKLQDIMTEDLNNPNFPVKITSTGRRAYYSFGPELSGEGVQREITRRAEESGIKGIRYKDAYSRGKEEGTSNFVVFDPEIIEIARRYGIALPLAGAVVAGQMTPEEAVAAQAPKEMEDGGAVTKGIGALEASEDVDRVLGAMEFNELPDRIQVAAEEVAEKTGLDKRVIAANMMLGDLEFAADVAPFFGPFYQSENIDPSVARLVPGNIPMETAQGRMKGFYIPEQMSDNELRQLQSRAQLYAFSPREGYFPEAQMERDTVYAVGPDASPEVWAHEFRHRALSRGPRDMTPYSGLSDRAEARMERYQSYPPSQEGDNRLLDILYSNRPETYVSRSAAPYPQNALAAEAFFSGESPTGGPARTLLDTLVDAGMVNPNDLYPEFKDPTMFERMFGSEGPTRQDIKDRLREPENTARGRLAREKAKSNN